MSYDEQNLNYSLFDQLLVDFLHHEGFLKGDNNNKKFAEEYDKYKQKKKIKDFVWNGKIIEAIELTKEVNSNVLNDQKLMFKLYKQQFLEFLRNGDVENALSYAKSIETRTILGNTLHSALLSSVGTHESDFTFLFRYLVITHFHYHALQGSESPLPQIERLILADTDSDSGNLQPASPLPPVSSGPDSMKITDQDIQLLVQTVQISQKQALDSLKRAKGVVKDALQSELSKMKLNSDLLVSLTIEYCQFRGIISAEKELIKDSKPVQENDKVETLRHMRQLSATAGNTTEILKIATSLDPTFPEWAPLLFFDLKQCEYVDSINSRDFPKALDIMRDCLAPMSIQFPELAPKVRESAVLIAFNDSPPPLPILKLNPSHLAGPLYTALGQKTGIAEPEMITILKYLLHVHTLWFAMMGSNDGFENMFKLQELKTADVPRDNIKPPETKQEQKEVVTDEAITTLMEFMSIPKDEAINLLKAYDGNLDNIFASWMS